MNPLPTAFVDWASSGLLWGLLLASVPILIHLLNRRRYRTVRWAALEFLRAAFRKNQKRLRIENLLLLIVRTALIVFIVLALARPTIEGGAVITGRAVHHTILLDNSFSMGLNHGRGVTSFDRALEEVRAIVEHKDGDDPVTLYLTNDQETPPVEPRKIFGDLKRAEDILPYLDRLAVSPLRSEMSESLALLARDLVKKESGKVVYLVTDLQRCSLDPPTDTSPGDTDAEKTTGRALHRLLGKIKDKVSSIKVIDVGASATRDVNVAVASLRPAEDRPLVAGSLETFEARIVNYGTDPKQLSVSFSVDGHPKGSTSVFVEGARPGGPPGETLARFAPPELQAGSHIIGAKILEDALPLDDQRSFVAEVRESIRVLAVDGDPHAEAGLSSETLYLVNAIAPEEDPFVEVEVVDYFTFLTKNLAGVDVLILANVERVSERKIEEVERHVEDGGGLVVFLGNLVDPSLVNRDLVKVRDGLPPEEREGLLPGELDAAPFVVAQADSRIFLDLNAPSHPLLDAVLGPGADPEGYWKDLSPKVWGYYPVKVPVAPNVRVLLRYTDEGRSPALVEKRFGRGRVLQFTTAADLDWNEFPNGNAAVPLIHTMIFYLAAGKEEASDLLPYQTFTRIVRGSFSDVRAVDPHGGSIPVVSTQNQKKRQTLLELAQTREPGPYRVQLPRVRGVSAAREIPFTVSVDPAESDVRRMAKAEFLDLYGGEGTGLSYMRTFTVGKDFEGDDDDDDEDEISSLLVGLVLLLLFVEVFLARRFGDFSRHQRSAEAPA